MLNKSTHPRIVLPRVTLNLAAAVGLFLGVWVMTGSLTQIDFLFKFLPSVLFVKQNATLGLFLFSIGLLSAAMSGYLSWTLRRAEDKARELEAERIASWSAKETALIERQKNIEIQEVLACQAQDLLSTNTELKVANDRLHHMAHRDPLTQFLNRHGLQEVLTREVACLRREDAGLTVVLMDLDNLKAINDRMGYVVGDIVIKEVALKIQSALRATDYQGRIGGDEFMIFLPKTRLGEGLRIAEKLRLAVSETPVFLVSGSVKVSASLGVITASEQTVSIDELLARSHLRLLKSKREGKNCISFEGDEGRSETEFERSVTEILAAIDKEKAVHAVKQAIYTLQDERIFGYEFLSRMSVPGFEMPDEFFPLCMEAKILPIIDRSCFKTCLKAALPLAASYQCHVNIFPSTMLDIPVKALLGEFYVKDPLNKLCVEISEQQIIGDPAHLLETVEAFKEAGVKVGIDDVGFGKTSLESIIILDPDIIKIDKRCVIGVSQNSARARSIERLLRMAASLGMQVIAEGIQTREDLETLKRLGVRYGQGFLWGKPA